MSSSIWSDLLYFSLRYWPMVVIGLIGYAVLAILAGKMLRGAHSGCSGCGGAPILLANCAACARECCAVHAASCKCGALICEDCAKDKARGHGCTMRTRAEAMAEAV